MVSLSILGIIGAVIALIGTALGTNAIIGVGVLLFFASFFVSSFVLSSIPSVVWVFGIILLIWILSQKKK